MKGFRMKTNALILVLAAALGACSSKSNANRDQAVVSETEDVLNNEHEIRFDNFEGIEPLFEGIYRPFESDLDRRSGWSITRWIFCNENRNCADSAEAMHDGLPILASKYQSGSIVVQQPMTIEVDFSYFATSRIFVPKNAPLFHPGFPIFTVELQFNDENGNLKTKNLGFVDSSQLEDEHFVEVPELGRTTSVRRTRNIGYFHSEVEFKEQDFGVEGKPLSNLRFVIKDFRGFALRIINAKMSKNVERVQGSGN